MKMKKQAILTNILLFMLLSVLVCLSLKHKSAGERAVNLAILVTIIPIAQIVGKRKYGREYKEEDSEDEGTKNFLITSYNYYKDADEKIAECMESSKHIKLVGVCINLFVEDKYSKILLEHKGEITICIANPHSPYVREFKQNLYDVREKSFSLLDDCPNAGSVNKTYALIKGLHDKKEKRNINIRLINHPTTFAAFVLDDDFFFYPYGYKKLGIKSPVFHFRKEDKKNNRSSFFIDVVKKTIDHSFQADDVLAVWEDSSYRAHNWIEAALIAKPEIPTRCNHLQVDSFRQYYDERWWEIGIHFPIIDTLTYTDDIQVERIHNEIKEFIENLARRNIGLELLTDDRDNQSLKVRCNDINQIMDLVRCNLYHSMNRSSIEAMSSVYEAQRNNGSIFDATVLSSLPPNQADKKALIEKIKEDFKYIFRDGEVKIDKLCLITKKYGMSKWEEKEFPLKHII